MDAAGHIIFHAADLLARATTETATATSAAASATSTAAASIKRERPGFYKIVGIVLAVTSGLFIGTSFVIKKVGLLKANVKYQEEAGEGYGYLKNAWWWFGMILMIVGEICNFVAYAFTDAILVTPLGALSVVVCTVLSWVVLKERLSFVGWVACFLCIVGSVVITLNAPEQSAVSNIQDMQHYVVAPGFLSFAGVIILGCLVMAFYVAPKYGKRTMMVDLTICSLIGGLSVVATQGLGAAIIAQIGGEAQFNKWFLYVLFVFVICTLVTEIIYLNKALNVFNAALVTPTYYVYFTSSTIVTSAVLFRGFHGTTSQIIDVVMGFLTICSGVVLLQLAKSSKEVPDSKVLGGDLDEIRTVAEVEEPEYEPRADTIRGGAGILRALSKSRTKREADEAKRIHGEKMAVIGEDEVVEWDGLRRRKTVSTQGGSIKRHKTVHPPLGMSHFPDPDDESVSEADSEVHPGFFGRIGRNFTQRRQRAHSQRGHSPVPMGSIMTDKSEVATHVYDLPDDSPRDPTAHDGDPSYHAPGTRAPPGTAHSHVQWAGGDNRSRADSQSSSLAPPRPPPHTSSSGSTTPATSTRRQFSFQNVFSRSKSDDSAADGSNAAGVAGALPSPASRPISRGALSFHSQRAPSREYPTGSTATEEERLGLVHGDSQKHLSKFDEDDEDGRESGEWQVTSGSSSSPVVVSRNPDDDGAGTSGRASRGGRSGGAGSYDDDDDNDDLYDAHVPRRPGDGGSGRGGRAFV